MKPDVRKCNLNIRLILFSFLTFFLIQCSKNPDPIKPTSERDQKWVADIDYFAKELPKRHINLFFQLSSAEFSQKVNDLMVNVPDMKDYEIVVSLMKIVASVGDEHTTLSTGKTGIFHSLPIELAWFSDGLYIIATISDYQNVIGKRITKIGSYKVEDLNNCIQTIIPHSNEAQIKNIVPSCLVIPEFLDALGITDSTDVIPFQFEDMSEVLIYPQIVAHNANIVTLYDNMSNPLPLYLQKTKLNYWFTAIEDSTVVYAQYNRCAEMTDESFQSFTNELFAFVDAYPVDQFIFDMRLNGGGSSIIAQPLIDGIKIRQKINSPGHLFVIIGRKTFSSAILNSLDLKNQTQAVFVGEATGGKPNHYGEVRSFELLNSRIQINYSTKHFTYSAEDTPSLYPDIPVDLSFSDFMSGKDTALDAILNY